MAPMCAIDKSYTCTNTLVATDRALPMAPGISGHAQEDESVL